MSLSSVIALWTATIGFRIKQVSRLAENCPWVVVLCTVGVTLRWTGMAGGGLWYDEAFSVVMTRLGLLEMIAALSSNISPPGWETVLWFVTRVLGQNELAYRIVPFIASVLTLGVFWRLTQVLRLTRAQALFGLALLVLSPYQFWVAQEARMYAVTSLLYLLGVLWAWEEHYWRLGLAIALLLWFHNTGIFFAASLGMLALLVHPRQWRAIVVVGIVALASWLPWVSVLFNQSQQNIPWLESLTWQILTFDFVFDLFASTALWLNGPALPVVFFYISLGLALVLQLSRLFKWLVTSRKTDEQMGQRWGGLKARWDGVMAHAGSWVPMWVFWSPFALFLISGLFFQNTLMYRTATPLMPPLILWLAVALIPDHPKAIHWIVPVAWIGLFIMGLLVWSPRDRGKNSIEVIEVIKKEWQTGDIVYYANDMSAVQFSVYLSDAPQYVIDEQDLAGGKGTVELAKLNIQRGALEQIPHRRAWIVSPYYDYPSPPNERMADRRMRVYTSQCATAGIISYWQHAWVGVYLCGDPTHVIPEAK